MGIFITVAHPLSSHDDGEQGLVPFQGRYRGRTTLPLTEVPFQGLVTVLGSSRHILSGSTSACLPGVIGPPNFIMFLGEGKQSTVDHLAWFLCQIGKATGQTADRNGQTTGDIRVTSSALGCTIMHDSNESFKLVLFCNQLYSFYNKFWFFNQVSNDLLCFSTINLVYVIHATWMLPRAQD